MKLINQDFYSNGREVIAPDLAKRFELNLRHGLNRVGHFIWLCVERAKQRRALAEIDDHLLDDIKVSREAAQREARKPFWQP